MIQTTCCLERHTVLESGFPAVRLGAVCLSFVNFQNQQSESLHRLFKLVGHVYLGVKIGGAEFQLVCKVYLKHSVQHSTAHQE